MGWREFGLMVAAAFCSAALIMLLLPLFRRYAVARPNARSSHRIPTPQGGGAAVILAVAIALTADIAEEKLCHRPVERSKAQHGTAQRERHRPGRRRHGAEQREDEYACRGRHRFGDRHPVDAVHEVDQIDEPKPGNDLGSALDRKR